MAGVYIKGMEMPKCCGDCPFRLKVNPEENECTADHHVFEETFGRLMHRRDEKCPIFPVPVPDHGDLMQEPDLMCDIFGEPWDPPGAIPVDSSLF